MSRIGIIGAGISGLTLAKSLSDRGHNIEIFDPEPLGIANYASYHGIPVHHVGGHCLSTKRENALRFVFDNILPEQNWEKLERKARVSFDGRIHSYPIELSLSEENWPEDDVSRIAGELEELTPLDSNKKYENLADYFYKSFGQTLSNSYFIPYNRKIWCEDPENMSYEWLEGKIPQISPEQILKKMTGRGQAVGKDTDHQTFIYPRIGPDGVNSYLSAFSKVHPVIRLAVDRIAKRDNTFSLYSDYECLGEFERLFYTGDLRKLPNLLGGEYRKFSKSADLLEINQVTVAVVQGPFYDYSWLYVPSDDFCFHRIINMSYFAKKSEQNQAIYAVETTGACTSEQIIRDIIKFDNRFVVCDVLPPKNGYVRYTVDSGMHSENLKKMAKQVGIQLCGRFASWNYNNMDLCISEALLASDF